MATVHPHKGYLNTKFRVHLMGDKNISYSIFPSNKEDEIILQGEAIPNKPLSFTIPIPGDFTVKFEDGTMAHLFVEDGYRFGGSKYKNAFIFDKCPWAFIVMHDREYFYNRETGESYVEHISPDNVIEISKDYVLFESNGQNEKLLYSLKEQKPLLDIANIIKFNEHAVVWKEEYKRVESSEPITNVKIYSLLSQNVICEYEVDGVHTGDDEIFIINKNQLIRIHLDESLTPQTIIPDHQGIIIAVVDSKMAVTYKEERDAKVVFVYDVRSGIQIGNIQLEGTLAKVNDITLININERRNNIRNTTILDSEFPEATITAYYTELKFFPSDWRTFYSIKTTSVIKSRGNFKTDAISSLCALNTDLKIPLKDFDGDYIFLHSAFCFYNNSESFVQGKNHSGAGYHSGGKIYKHNNVLILKEGDTIRRLSSNGYWDNPIVGDFDLGDFAEYNVIHEKGKGSQYGFDGMELRGTPCHHFIPNDHLSIDNYVIYLGGIIFQEVEIPKIHSKGFNYGLRVDKKGITLIDIQQKSEKTVMASLFDLSEYKNVLFSEDGSQIIFRNNQNATVLKYESCETVEFKCESYIQQFNGIRPYFKLPDENREDTRQVEIINPVNGKIIPVDSLSDYVFISPDFSLYADTKLLAYEYYYDLLNECEISSADVDKLRSDLAWVKPYDIDNIKNKMVLQRRTYYIRKNIDRLMQVSHEKRYKCYESEQAFLRYFATPEAISGYDDFFKFLFERRGRVIIRSTKNAEEVARIELGPALWFLNYVSFSFDNKYVCIGGRYPNHSEYGGLFMIYDLERDECICKKTDCYAIWTTAFNKDGMVAAYSGRPILYYNSSPDEYGKEPEKVPGYSFLTFSPDGKYIALSNKGYIAYHSGNGTTRNQWGHIPTSDVYICSSSAPNDKLIQFCDLSEEGIEGIADPHHTHPHIVSSVSFSIDNRKLMMVGRDGVVVIRNLHLDI